MKRQGRFIGQLERTIVLIFYLGGSLEGIAFLVIAKSIYRFGDLRKGHDSEHASGGEPGDMNDEVFSISEYIILGSLLSYTAAIVGGVAVDVLFELMEYA